MSQKTYDQYTGISAGGQSEIWWTMRVYCIVWWFVHQNSTRKIRRKARNGWRFRYSSVDQHKHAKRGGYMRVYCMSTNSSTKTRSEKSGAKPATTGVFSIHLYTIISAIVKVDKGGAPYKGALYAVHQALAFGRLIWKER